MKQSIQLKIALLLIVILSSGCSGASKNPATDLPQTQPTAGGAATETPAQNPNIVPSPTPEVVLFTTTGGTYSINLTAADFVEVIDNPYFPLPPGAKWEYEIRLPNGSKQKDTLEVMKEKRDVNGVQATVVRDTVSSGDQIVEDTYDWFVQDKYGNVWYVGEAVDNYSGGVLTGHGGSWEWGVDGALPGIIMWADPSAHVNDEYFQEYYVGKAEDKGKVLKVDESLTVPFASYDQVVETLDFSAIEVTANEHKFYAPGIGLIRELEASGGDEVVLVNFTSPTP